MFIWSYTNRCLPMYSRFWLVFLTICRFLFIHFNIEYIEPILSNRQVTKSSAAKKSPGYGSVCLTHADCQHSTVQLECYRGACVCLEGYVPLGKYLCYNIHGRSNEFLGDVAIFLISIICLDAPIIESSTYSSTPTTMTSTFNPPNNEFLKSLGKLGNPCTNDYYCRRSVSQSHCYNGRCSCIVEYISIDPYTCIKGN